MKTFKPYNPDQLFLLPPALRDWLPEGHLALFVSNVVDALDLTPILATYADGDGRGQTPYHPALMVKLLVYGYCTGKPSSRRIEKATYEEVPYSLGHVALDGTKVLANASEHKAMSHGRMGEAERQLEQEVAALLAQAAQVDLRSHDRPPAAFRPLSPHAHRSAST